MKKLTVLFAILLTLTTCSKDISDFNTHPTPPAQSVLASATISLFDMMADSDYRSNHFRNFAQHWAIKAFSLDYKTVLLDFDLSENTWITSYNDVLKNLKEVKNLLEENKDLTSLEIQSQKAVVIVLESYVYTFLVDVYGNIPYSEALSDNLKPTYDEGKDVYDGVLLDLDKAIDHLGQVNTLIINDLMYQGNPEKWKKMANSLKLRMAIRLADSNNEKAKLMVEQAVQNGVFSSNIDNFSLSYEHLGNIQNPILDVYLEGHYCATNTLGDVLNALNDPRRSIFFKNLDQNEKIVGIQNGEAANPDASTPSVIIENASLENVLFSYSEVQFLLADAAERSYDVGGAAADFYTAGVTNSITKWGGSTSDAMTYIAQPGVAYDTALGTWKEKIALQKWIALYNRGFEAWTTFRLYDAPQFNIPTWGVSPVIQTPSRFFYPPSEATLNGVNVEAANVAIGGDRMTTKVFWDVN